MTVIGLIYGLSRFVNGFIADRMNGRWHMSVGLLLCVLASVAFGFSPQILGIRLGVAPHALVVLFGVLLVLNNIFQGSGFPPCARLLTHWIPPTELATKMSVWNTSHSIGASLLAILCGYIMGTMGRDMSADQPTLTAIRDNLLRLNPSLADDSVKARPYGGVGRFARRGMAVVLLDPRDLRPHRRRGTLRVPARHAQVGRAARAWRARIPRSRTKTIQPPTRLSCARRCSAIR